ncbi:FAD-binding domain-containing protein [Annulohypoxylon maeteangense]|uniref:FAD-binding domain-containing protein n=1 Tax=Annulohypoxylon maeteangense TaxID=1927788 RepID=UPI00200859F7|nr:FAD-binding domain-containing protein [Annulohypoxylon maeteangense]KAI0890522.1 FAD-binding domain-containing protein [Annulohypoxylon maeteangense]
MASVMESAISSLKEAGLEDVLYTPGHPAYEARVGSYWSLTSRQQPWAIVQPRNTEEVSKIVKALVGIAGCKFAIRSGGHMPHIGAGNAIEEGVTIDLGLMTETTYHPKTRLASILPGAKWRNVYADMEKHGMMVAGGREGLVGVGGLLTGGGLTFYNCRYGWGCDQVVNYEVVLGDGSVIEANKTMNSDLFRVLKGGHNNFGIVTRFDMQTFKAHDIWDGSSIISPTYTDEAIDAYVDFSKKLAKNANSHATMMFAFVPYAQEHIINVVFTSLDGVENPETFQNFLRIPGQQEKKMTTVATKVAEFLLPSGRYDFWMTITFKLDSRVIRKAIDAYEALLADLKKAIPDSNFSVNMVFQPLLASWTQHSVDQGSNIFGLEHVTEDCVVLVIAVEVATSELSKKVSEPATRTMFSKVESYATLLDKNVGFLYLNYCDGSQDPLKSYGEENIKRMKEASAKYDPAGVFQERVPGGFKISKVE